MKKNISRIIVTTLVFSTVGNNVSATATVPVVTEDIIGYEISDRIPEEATRLVSNVLILL